MREIKFRGFTGTHWEYGDLVRNTGDETFIHFYDCNGFECLYRVYPESVGQYTGIRDSNGRDIYEGDILQGNMGHYTVIWDSEGCRFVANNGNYNLPLSVFSQHQVIGNGYLPTGK